MLTKYKIQVYEPDFSDGSWTLTEENLYSSEEQATKAYETFFDKDIDYFMYKSSHDPESANVNAEGGYLVLYNYGTEIRKINLVEVKFHGG